MWRSLILGSALGLHMFGNETSISGQATLYECLRFIDERIGQRIVADITYRQRLPFSIKDKIDTTAHPADGTGFDCSRNPQTMPASRSLQGRQLRDGVVIGLALTVSEPSQKPHGNNDDADADAEFCVFLQ
jgi:hypothetical protein